MLRCETNDIIAAAKRAITAYEKDCNTIPGGANGLARKKRLEELLNDIQLQEPTAVFIELYQFIARDEKLSRLLSHLEDELVKLAKIPPTTSISFYRTAIDGVNRGKALSQFIKALNPRPTNCHSIN